jgi:T5SS/PEP-CTERM-associated repeat protein
MNAYLKCAVAACALLSVAAPLKNSAAQTRTWTGKVDSLWRTPENWDPLPPGFPTAADNAHINNGGSVTIDQTAAANRLSVSRGMLSLTPGSSLTTKGVGIADTGDSAAIVDGATWTNTGSLFVGYTKNGRLEILGGSHMTTDNGPEITFGNDSPILGWETGTTGTVIVDASTWEIKGDEGDVRIGFRGKGVLEVRNGSNVSVEAGQSVNIGDFANSKDNLVTVDNSTFLVKGILQVGINGSGTLNIQNGGSVTGNSFVAIASGNNAVGAINVMGANSKLNANALSVGGFFGANGIGQLNVSEGGVVTANFLGVSKGSVISQTGGSRIGIAQDPATVPQSSGVYAGSATSPGALQLGIESVLNAEDNLYVGRSGTLRGTGRVNAPQTINAGTIELTGTRQPWGGGLLHRDGINIYQADMVFDGDFEQTATGKINIMGLSQEHKLQPEIFHSTAILVTGTAHLDGELTVGLSHLPAVGDRFAILTAQEITGKIAKFNGAVIAQDRFLGLNYRRDSLDGEPVLEVITLEAPRRAPLSGDHTARNLVIVTHGTNADADAWAYPLATEMAKHIPAGEQWEVAALDWRDFSAGGEDEFKNLPAFDPWLAGSNAINIGESLVRWYGNRQFDNVHILAHSAGAWLANAVADAFVPRGTNEKVHLTLFDPFAPNDGIHKQDSFGPLDVSHGTLGASADFVDSYFHRHFAVLDTDYTLPNAVNIDLSALEMFINPIGSHAFPYVWYSESAALPGSTLGGYGAALSRLYDGMEFPAYGSRKGKLFLMDIAGDPVEAEPEVEDVDLNEQMNVVTGNATLTPGGGAKLTTGSPAILTSLIDLEQPFQGFQFDYEFLSENPGLLSVYFGGEQVFGFENGPLGLGPGDDLSTGLIWLDDDYLPGTHSITFRLDPLAELAASLEISNLQFVSLVPAGGLALAADFNSDGVVNAADLATWTSNFGVTAATRAQGDADGDADVDGNDFLIWQRNVGAAGAETLQSAVPEPTSGALLIGGICAIVLRGRRQAWRSAP